MISMGSSMQGWGSSGGVPSHIRKAPTTLKASPWQLVRRLAGIIVEFKRDLILSLVCVIGAAGLQITMPWAFKRVIDTTIPSGNARELVVIAIALAIMQAVRWVLNYGQRYYLAVVTQQLVYRMSKDLFEHVQRLSLRFFERWGTGEIISRTTNDIQALQQMVQGTTIMSIASAFNMAAFAVIMFLLNWQMALLVIARTVTGEKLRVR